MRRITTHEVLEAYRKTGLKPVRGVFTDFNGGRCGCAITALSCANGTAYSVIEDIVTDEMFPVDRMADIVGLNRDYANGFVQAFDAKAAPQRLKMSEEYTVGYQDGELVAAAVFGEVTA